MTRFERERIAAEIARQNRKADMAADSFLDKLKASKWTGLMLLVVAVFVVVALASLF